MAEATFTGGGQRFVITEPTTITDASGAGWGFLQNIGNNHIMAHTKFPPSFQHMQDGGRHAGLFLSSGEVMEITSAGTIHVDTADGIYPAIFVLCEKI